MTAARRITLAFDRQCAAFSLPAPIAEMRFHPARRWRQFSVTQFPGGPTRYLPDDAFSTVEARA